MLKFFTILGLMIVSSTGFTTNNICTHYERSFLATTDIIGKHMNSNCLVKLYLEKSELDTSGPYYDVADSSLRIQNGAELETPAIPRHVSLFSNTLQSSGIQSCSKSNGDMRSVHDSAVDKGFVDYDYRISSLLRGLDASGKSILVHFYCTKRFEKISWYDFAERAKQINQINDLESLYKKTFESLFYDQSGKGFQIIPTAAE